MSTKLEATKPLSIILLRNLLSCSSTERFGSKAWPAAKIRSGESATN